MSLNDAALRHRLLALRAIIRDAGHVAMAHFRRRGELQVELKGMQDLVSAADREVEEIIRGRLAESFPEDAVIGEEGGTEAAAASGPLWVIDPIDGTANFLRGVPYWSVAIALLDGQETVVAATYDPVHDELFSAWRGHGAERNGQAIAVSGCADTRQAVIGSTFTFKMRQEDYLAHLTAILAGGSDHRRLGSTALMMCHAADGRLDACTTLYCNSWDVIGGLLIAAEAGAVASDFLDGASLTEPNSAFACGPGLAAAIRALPGWRA